jgi:hypothetical protein
MLNRTVRHLVVAEALVAVAGLTAASAAGSAGTRSSQRMSTPPTARQVLPQVSGDLGEVIVRAPGDLGEIVVHAPGDLGEVLVSAARLPADGQLMAEVVVTAPRVDGAELARAIDAATGPALMAAAR